VKGLHDGERSKSYIRLRSQTRGSVRAQSRRGATWWFSLKDSDKKKEICKREGIERVVGPAVLGFGGT